MKMILFVVVILRMYTLTNSKMRSFLRIRDKNMNKMSSYQVAVAAEAFSAGLFAQAGCDVSIQYGANQPEYDLIVTRKNQFLKVSVKGSQDGGWGLNQGHKNKNVSYHEAVDNWVRGHQSIIIYCLVQFKNIKIGECPRLYLATIEDIASALKNARNGHGADSGVIAHRFRSYPHSQERGNAG